MTREIDIDAVLKAPAALDAFLTDRSLHIPVPAVETMDGLATQALTEVDAWAEARRSRRMGNAERLVVAWVRKKLPELRTSYEGFREFLVAERETHPSWGFMHFVARWLTLREPQVLRDMVTLYMVIALKTFEEQEREARPAAMALVKQLRAMRKATVALRRDLEKHAAQRSDFWTRFEQKLSGRVEEVFGEEARRSISEAWKKHLSSEQRSPLQLALERFQPKWVEVCDQVTGLADETLAAIQASFVTETVVAARHAPPKRGVHRRIVELARAGMSHSEIAAFEGMSPKAVAEYLRRERATARAPRKAV